MVCKSNRGIALAALALFCVLGAIHAHEGHDHGPDTTASAPASGYSSSAFANPLEAILATPSLSYLQYGVLACGLEGSFVAPDTSFTILAPSNAAFQNLSVDFLTSQRLGGILAYHVLPSARLTSDLSNGMIVPTLWGLTLNVSVSGDKISFDGGSNQATVVTQNIRAGNNVIHIVDNLLDRRSNPSIISSPQAQATLAKINYSTMLQLPARAPGQSPHNDTTHVAPAPQAMTRTTAMTG